MHGEALKVANHGIRHRKNGMGIVNSDHPSAKGRRANLNAAIQARNYAGYVAWFKGAQEVGRKPDTDEIKAFAQYVAHNEGTEAGERALIAFGWSKASGHWEAPA